MNLAGVHGLQKSDDAKKNSCGTDDANGGRLEPQTQSTSNDASASQCNDGTETVAVAATSGSANNAPNADKRRAICTQKLPVDLAELAAIWMRLPVELRQAWLLAAKALIK